MCLILHIQSNKMVKSKIQTMKPFRPNNLTNKNLIIQMLKFEDEFGKSENGQKFYKTDTLNPRTSLEPIYAIHRCVLSHFGFDTTDQSVDNYRKIFQTYYKSPTDYDREVINSVYYMRANKCVFYNLPKPQIGDNLIDCNLLTLNGKSTTLITEISKLNFDKCFVGAFSNS